MVYIIESMEDGSVLTQAETYEKALILSKSIMEEKGIDVYIRKEE